MNCLSANRACSRLGCPPCETDAIGIAYRKDWFEDPAEKSAFEAKHGYALAAPKTWDEFREYAKKLTKRDAQGNITVNPTLFPNLPYKQSELAPVTMLATSSSRPWGRLERPSSSSTRTVTVATPYALDTVVNVKVPVACGLV